MTAMQCPVCRAAFHEVIKEGILIDVCTQCKGVWLDRGELEKLLAIMRADDDDDRPVAAPPPSSPYREAPPAAVVYREALPPHYSQGKPYRYDDDDHYHGHKRYRKKSKMEMLFDIFD